MDWNDELLISEVAKYPQLWDKNVPQFKEKYQKDTAWSTIAGMMNGRTGKECEQRFSVLRMKYAKEKRKLHVLASCGLRFADQESTWPHFQAMRFLDPFMTRRKRIRNNVAAGSLKQLTIKNEVGNKTASNLMSSAEQEDISIYRYPDEEVDDRGMLAYTSISEISNEGYEEQTSNSTLISNKTNQQIDDDIESTMVKAISTFKRYFQQKCEGDTKMITSSQSMVFLNSVQILLDGIRNRRRRRRVQAKIAVLLAETRSDSENSD